MDPSQGVRVGAVVLAHENLDLRREAEEAAGQVPGDPMPSGVGHARRRLGGVVPLVLAEQHDLGAVILAAEEPRLLRLAQRPPVVDVSVRPPLGLESPAPVGVALEAHQRTMPLLPRAVLQPVRVARAGGDLRSHAEVAAAGLLAAAGRQLVDVVAQLLGGHAGAGIDDRELAHAAAGCFEPLPVQIPHHPAGAVRAERCDRVQPVDGQLTQTLKVRALDAEALEQERRVRDRELVPPVRGGHRAVGDVGQFSELVWHPARQVPDAAAEASTPTRVNRPQTRLSAPRPTTRTGRSRSPEPATPSRSGARLPHPRVRARACATNRRRTAPRRAATAGLASPRTQPACHPGAARKGLTREAM